MCLLGCGKNDAALESPPQPDPEPEIVVITDAASRFSPDRPAAPDDAPVLDSEADSEIMPEMPAVVDVVDQSQPSDQPDESELAVAAEVASNANAPDNTSRLLLPTTAGVLLVDLDVLIGDQPLEAYFQQYLADIETAARGDADVLRWENLQNFVSENPGRFGRRVQVAADAEEQFDDNKNGIVERSELRKFLYRQTRDAGAWQVNSHDRNRQRNRRESPIFLALDQDTNQRLDANEMAQAAQRLLRLDRNFDQRLDDGEAADESSETSTNRSASRSFGTTAQRLQEIQNWERLSYGIGGLLAERPFAASGLKDKLDTDRDGQLSRDEIKTLANTPADLRLHIWLSDDQSEAARLEHTSTSESLQAAFEETPSQLAVSDMDLHVTIRVLDIASRRDAIPQQAFEALDADKDGLLSEAEIPPQADDMIRFEEFDVNQDGGLSLAEINAGLRGDMPPWMTQVRIEANEAADAWFVWLDTNGDRFLSTREIAAAGKRLAALDRDGDGVIDWHDVPDAYCVDIVRSDPEDAGALARAITASPSPLPNWAAQLDHNADSEISWQEFVGTRTQFNQLDADRDGYLTKNELQASP